MEEGLAKIRNARSKKDFPFLKLEDDEYVEFAFLRAKVCLFLIYAGIAAGLAVVLFAFLIVLFGQNTIDAMGRNFLMIILLCIIATALLACGIATMVHRGNRLFVTNKHVIQKVMKSPFATSVNEIDLSSVEDASFHQNGILQNLFGYGTFRLSTVGDETTYTLNYANISAEELKAVSKLITEAKAKSKKEAE